MVNPNLVHPERMAAVRQAAAAHFGPIMLREALLRLCDARGCDVLDDFEKAVTRRIEETRGDGKDFDMMKDFAVEQLLLTVRELRRSPDLKRSLEDHGQRRTKGRSEIPETLEEQLHCGLEDTFPASDPPAVVSTAIAGRTKRSA